MRSGNFVNRLMYRGYFGRCSRGLDVCLGEACGVQAELDAENCNDVGGIRHCMLVHNMVGVVEGRRFPASSSKASVSRPTAIASTANVLMA